MEIMEDGNLVDRVRILLQRDMQYYQEMQTVLKEPLCTRVCGGKLDFPRHASFAAIKIVMWWEVDFQAAFNRHSGLTKSSEHETDASTEIEGEVIKKIQPSEFILLVVDTAEHLLEHLHLLIQESLDHADLTVLTATLGAAALIRNCLWCYSQQTKNLISPQASEKINKSYKSYHEMAEAVAERLLDLHCRLISLYILNEADSLSWHDMKAFFERERCSFVIQMWWLYMQATKADLWNTVSPKMAQRVFSGMLNESLSIIVTRFIDARPSLSRSQQFWTDAFNVLCCTGYLALNACVSVSEMIGLKLNTLPVAVRDIHTKCNELLVCLLLRGTPVQEIYQVFRDGFENLTIFQPRCGPATWLLMCAPNLLGSIDSDVYISNLPDDRAVILELNILRHQPQPNWPQLIKVISMNDYAVAKILLDTLIHDCSYFTSEDYFDNLEQLRVDGKNCGGFLCNNMTCYGTLKITSALSLYSLMLILTSIAQEPGHVIAPALRRNHNWSNYLDRQQVWNQSRPPWLNAILKPLSNTMEPIIEILLEAVKTGASIYQTMSLVIGCFAELYVTLPPSILKTAFVLNDNIPAHCHPIGGNVLLHILCASLYTALLNFSKNRKPEVAKTPASDGSNNESNLFNSNDAATIVIALAEAICSIDEDNKHTSQIDDFFQRVKEYIQTTDTKSRIDEATCTSSIIETTTDELLFTKFGRQAVKVTHEFLIRSSDLVLNKLRHKDAQERLINVPEVCNLCKPLTYIMFHIEDTTFDQFLVQYEKTNWRKALTMPFSITVERARSQILLRSEFRNVGELTYEDREAMNSIKKICSSIKTTHFK
ncbi:uncharacterized protein LOC128877038 isoform X2 [Hylaeus volcanicus]|uniref:uncharacterized protein LOC128877038 isoform X2 n=1 Tax=Hylaeus volcanicus TaxID=313075 RepID=UPI0023B78884|nr:uncharacterized protein LOC128877038 isoform X2 [Hylaeus volcanicus]